ncbi:hypothetical protein EFP18_15280 [Burkholderia glumae]|nr:hypothetical protein CEQ24_016555 [Burkholderia glumae]RQZ75548.1 hypothetical protein DF052_03880 [Burkholderia glumae]UVS85340.1 hypothetical protein EFP18_15280 [Burkholderia glumae]UVS91257.1 hypothetical protein EFP17_16665 [Burkholderia glumae]UVS96767.1 hypothetical protein EFP19_14105 [Burkholderia glumae]
MRELGSVPGNNFSKCFRRGPPLCSRAAGAAVAVQYCGFGQKKPGRMEPRSNNDKRRMVTRRRSFHRVP